MRWDIQIFIFRIRWYVEYKLLHMHWTGCFSRVAMNISTKASRRKRFDALSCNIIALHRMFALASQNNRVKGFNGAYFRRNNRVALSTPTLFGLQDRSKSAARPRKCVTSAVVNYIDVSSRFVWVATRSHDVIYSACKYYVTNCISRSEFAKSRIIIFDKLVVMIIHESQFFLFAKLWKIVRRKIINFWIY